MKRLGMMLVFALALPAAADGPADFAAGLRLEVPPGAALLRVALDERVYRAVRRADLGDLRVYNAAGEALPFARLPRAGEARPISLRVPLTTLPPMGSGGAEGARVSVEQSRGDSRLRIEVDPSPAEPDRVRLVADTRKFRRPVDMIALDLGADTVFEGRVRIETSEDLAGWVTLADNEPVLAVGRGDARLERTRIPLAGGSRRYLRLSWLGPAPQPLPQAVELIQHAAPAALPRQWLSLHGRAAGDSTEYLAPGLFPVDRLRLLPAEGNDVVPAQVASRGGVAARWQFRAATVGYRLEAGGSPRESPPVALPLTRDPLWRVTPQRSETAGTPPLLELGWVPEEIVFVARGEGPYLLAAGNPDRVPAWLPVRSLVPGYGTPDEPKLLQARIADGNPPVPARAQANSLWQAGPQWWLWGALGLGVGAMGWMARGVWRELRRGEGK